MLKSLCMGACRKRYNRIMALMGHERRWGISETVNSDWTVRDMVAQCDVVLDMHINKGHEEYEKYFTNRRAWKREVACLKDFIDTYKPFIDDYSCRASHYGSKYEAFSSF